MYNMSPNEKLGLVDTATEQLMYALLHRVPDVEPMDGGRPAVCVCVRVCVCVYTCSRQRC